MYTFKVRIRLTFRESRTHNELFLNEGANKWREERINENSEKCSFLLKMTENLTEIK